MATKREHPFRGALHEPRLDHASTDNVTEEAAGQPGGRPAQPLSFRMAGPRDCERCGLQMRGLSECETVRRPGTFPAVHGAEEAQTAVQWC